MYVSSDEVVTVYVNQIINVTKCALDLCYKLCAYNVGLVILRRVRVIQSDSEREREKERDVSVLMTPLKRKTPMKPKK
jgi:hypothetical protein